MNLKKYYLELAVFICGAVVMVFELVGSRVLAPALGTSLSVWTALIGIILAALSVGYWIGGALADRTPTRQRFSLIIFCSAIFVGLAVFIQGPLLVALQPIIYRHLSLAAVVSSLVLFAPASLSLGMVSPYAVRLKLEAVASSGSTVGNLYALSTLGSIVGTFGAGLYLIPTLGTVRIMLLLALVLVVVAVAVYPRGLLKTKTFAAVVIIGLLGLQQSVEVARASRGFFDIDTAYNRVLIYPSVDRASGRQTLNLAFDPFGTQSAMFLEGPDDLPLSYAKFYRLAEHFVPGFRKSLILGGAGYTYPRAYLTHYPEAYIDVVEIDPRLTELAHQHFRLVDNPRLTIYHQDARVFLNQTNERYDVVFGDAFQSPLAVPYQLTTREAVQHTYRALSDNGVAMVNLISAIDGPKGEFLRAEYATYKSVFPQVYLFPVMSMDGSEPQNVILVALKSEAVPSFENSNPELQGLLNRRWLAPVAQDMPVLTDDLAPVDYYIHKII